MRSNKKFDITIPPRKPSVLWHWLQNIVSAAFYSPVGGKIIKENDTTIKPPFIFVCNHGSIVDLAMAVKATRPYRVNFVTSLEQFVHREYMFRRMGNIYKRRFTKDLTVVRHIMHVLKGNKGVIGIFPEARFSIAGTTERLDGGIGKLAKTANCPVLALRLQGNFLRSPQWNKHPYRKVPVTGTLRQIVSREELESISAEEIQRRIEEHLTYDEYKWQAENKIEIKCKKRAENLHKILYQCPHCKKEYVTDSKGTQIWCSSCGKIWDMDVYGQLHCQNGEDKFTIVSDWFRWQRENVREEIRSGKYHFEDEARLEYMHSSLYGFKPLGNVKLTHDYYGFTIEGSVNGQPFVFNRPPSSMYSLHIEYDYMGRGDALDMSKLSDTYFVYPLSYPNCMTKLHLAAEEMFDYEQSHSKEPLTTSTIFYDSL